jgi:hypothetical protein
MTTLMSIDKQLKACKLKLILPKLNSKSSVRRRDLEKSKRLLMLLKKLRNLSTLT